MYFIGVACKTTWVNQCLQFGFSFFCLIITVFFWAGYEIFVNAPKEAPNMVKYVTWLAKKKEVKSRIKMSHINKKNSDRQQSYKTSYISPKSFSG